MSKAIYKPKGKAGEYAEWACNLYVGCSNDCDYCYCKRGVLGHVMGAPEATLKKCFKDEDDAFGVFCKELEKFLPELRKSSLFFTFSSDPMIPATRRLNMRCIKYAVMRGVRVQVLTKNITFLSHWEWRSLPRDMVAWGFTLTGCDDKERGASSNDARIAAMRYISSLGFKTFASLEPVISPDQTYRMAVGICDCCDVVKVGLLSGVKKDYYDTKEVSKMVEWIRLLFPEYRKHVYFKNSVTDLLGMEKEEPVDVFRAPVWRHDYTPVDREVFGRALGKYLDRQAILALEGAIAPENLPEK